MRLAPYASRLSWYALADAQHVARHGEEPRQTWAALAGAILALNARQLREAWFALRQHAHLAHPATCADHARADLLAFAHTLPEAFAAHFSEEP